MLCESIAKWGFVDKFQPRFDRNRKLHLSPHRFHFKGKQIHTLWHAKLLSWIFLQTYRKIENFWNGSLKFSAVYRLRSWYRVLWAGCIFFCSLVIRCLTSQHLRQLYTWLEAVFPQLLALEGGSNWKNRNLTQWKCAEANHSLCSCVYKWSRYFVWSCWLNVQVLLVQFSILLPSFWFLHQYERS